MSMKITLMPGTYEGNCIECGKRFIRRQIDSFDDGALCARHYKEWQKEQVSGGECKVVASSTDGLTTAVPKKWFELSCGHAFKLDGLDAPVACPVCGKAVKR